MSHVSEICLANARLVLPEETVTGSVRMIGGRIADIDTGAHIPSGAVDCGGDCVSPGLIELHTDNLERHMQPRPGVAWPRKAAIVAHDSELAGVGITTVFDALRVGSIFSNDRSHYGEYAYGVSQDIRALEQAGALKINHLTHLRAEICSETLLEELERFAPNDRIGLVSLMDHTPGQRQFRDIPKMKQYLGGKYGMTESEFEGHFAHLKHLQARSARRTRPEPWRRRTGWAQCWPAMTTPPIPMRPSPQPTGRASLNSPPL